MLFDQLAHILSFVAESFITMFPYLLLTIPLAVALRMSRASQFIRRAFVAQPLVAILLATLIGAFSPFCSCSVIPLIASLLIAGVPIGPVMAFWIASPTMDPEIFLLSLGMLGTDLAVARLVATLLMSIGAGLAAHLLDQRGFFQTGILREQKRKVDWSLRAGARAALRWLRREPLPAQPMMQPAPAAALITLSAIPVHASSAGSAQFIPAAAAPLPHLPAEDKGTAFSWQRLGKETWSATVLVVRFMLIAFVLEALITLYVPQNVIVSLLGSGNPSAIVMSALVGIPVYATNLTALPLISGLLQQGMLPGAALAFLLAGPATTIPAMTAVYGIARPRVFVVYLSAILVGAIALGYGYQVLISL